jgi:hypothetical protein
LESTGRNGYGFWPGATQAWILTDSLGLMIRDCSSCRLTDPTQAAKSAEPAHVLK